jgi:hypothetical protein
VQGNVRGLEDGPDLHSEGLAAGIALANADPGAAALERADLGFVGIAAMRAGNAICPYSGLYEPVSGGFIVKVLV